MRSQVTPTNFIAGLLAKIIKGKYFSGSGGGGYWSLDYVDSIGRVVIKERYD